MKSNTSIQNLVRRDLINIGLNLHLEKVKIVRRMQYD
jgi:hypothetical protein